MVGIDGDTMTGTEAHFSKSFPQMRANRSFWNVALAMIASLALLSGCATRGGPIPYDVAEFGLPDRTTAMVPLDELVAPLDKLQINVFRVPDLSGSYEVSVGGRLNLPLIGEIVAVNRTPAQIGAMLEQKYDARYLRDPDISVSILESQHSTLVLDGGIKSPGVFPMRGGTDLMTAIARGGGLSEEGNPKRVAIFRKIDGVSKAAAFDLSLIRTGQATNPAVYPGDIVYVDSASAPPYISEILSGLSTLALFARL